MEAIKGLPYYTIQSGLLYGISSVTRNILEPLKIDRKTKSLGDLVAIISKDLKNLNFKFDSVPLFDRAKENSVPGFIELYAHDVKGGGIVKINSNYSVKSQREALFHEYAHIRDDSLPILPADMNAINRKALYRSDYLRNIEFCVDMIAHTLMMPPDDLAINLLKTGFDVNKILDIYRDFDKGSVLWWLTLNVRYPCHFAWVMFERDRLGNRTIYKICDNCTFDHFSDPKTFDIETVLKNKNSAAFIAVDKKTNVQQISNIHGTEYYCYAYYETDMPKELVCEIVPDVTSSIDRLLVFGWPKNYYDLIQYTWNKP